MKFLQYASDILKHWVVSDVKSKFTLRSSSIPSFKIAIPRFTSCFESLRPNQPFTIASFHQPFLSVVATLIKLFIIRTNPVISQSLTIGYTFLTVVWMARCWVKKLMSVVGLTCRSAPSCLFLSLTLTSKMFISPLDHSAVNLIVGWKALSVSINYFKESSPCSQIKNISSICLHHMRGFSSISCKIISSRSPMNRMAYGGANVVPFAIPLYCFNVFSMNWKSLFFKTISASPTKVSVVIFPLDLRKSRKIGKTFVFVLHHSI